MAYYQEPPDGDDLFGNRGAAGPVRRPAPVSPAVYRRRRIVVFGGAAAVIILAVMGIRSLGGGSANAAQESEVTPSPTVSDPATPCGASDLLVAASTPGRTYGAGQEVPITVTITHVGERPCTVDASDTGRPILITSGKDRIWSSADCAVDSEKRTLTLAKGDADVSTLAWQRIRSAEDCPSGLPAPRPGTYTIVVSIPGAGDVTSEKVQVVLK